MSKRLSVLAATTAAVLTLSGCALGFDAGTNVKTLPGNGSSFDVDGIQIRGAAIVIDKASRTNATLIGTIINKSDVEFSVVGITGEGITQTNDVNVAVASGAIAQFGYQSANTVTFTGDFTPGTWVDAQLLLNGASPVKLHLMVNNNEGVYSDVEVSGGASVEATPVVTPAA